VVVASLPCFALVYVAGEFEAVLWTCVHVLEQTRGESMLQVVLLL
jgi:hypothetical protein